MYTALCSYLRINFFCCGFVRPFVNTHLGLCLQPNSAGHSQDIWSMWRSRVSCLTLLCLRSQNYENSALNYESTYIFSLRAWILVFNVWNLWKKIIISIIYTLVFFSLLILCKQLQSEDFCAVFNDLNVIYLLIFIYSYYLHIQHLK